MRSCARCGTMVDDYEVSGSGLCMNCDAAGSGHGTGTDVPCQRCGMYLPSTELKMWNSRLFCNYCIMDIQDEEQRMRGDKRREPEKVETIPEQISHGSGTCERCGRKTDSLYSLSGKRLCSSCYSQESSGGVPPEGKPSLFGQIIRSAKEKLGIRSQPRLITMEEASGPQEIVFDLRRRQMVGKKIGVESQSPLREGHHEDTVLKPTEKSKKGFFSRLGGKKGEGQQD